MTITTISSRVFNQDSSRAKAAAEHGPVFITDRGKPAHVLLNIAHYRKLVGEDMNLLDAVAQVGVEDFQFTPPRAHGFTHEAELD